MFTVRMVCFLRRDETEVQVLVMVRSLGRRPGEPYLTLEPLRLEA